jgi:hypothetical protein
VFSCRIVSIFRRLLNDARDVAQLRIDGANWSRQGDQDAQLGPLRFVDRETSVHGNRRSTAAGYRWADTRPKDKREHDAVPQCEHLRRSARITRRRHERAGGGQHDHAHRCVHHRADGATVVDGNGRVLMPGMIDNHLHSLFATRPQAQLLSADVASSICTMQEPTKTPCCADLFRCAMSAAIGLKKATDEGLTNGPRIYPSGAYISQTGNTAISGERMMRPRTPIHCWTICSVPARH